MNNRNNNEGGAQLSTRQIEELNERLRAAFQRDLPTPLENPWFTSRCMNRLPEKEGVRLMRCLSKISYGLAAVSLCGLFWWIFSFMGESCGIIEVLLLAMILPIVVVSCVCILAYPSLRRVYY